MSVEKCRVDKDHPRVCGEKTMSGVRELGKRGSPPRVRGEVPRKNAEVVKLGITPACAGRRQQGYMVAERCEDHPRVCGEK